LTIRIRLKRVYITNVAAIQLNPLYPTGYISIEDWLFVDELKPVEGFGNFVLQPVFDDQIDNAGFSIVVAHHPIIALFVVNANQIRRIAADPFLLDFPDKVSDFGNISHVSPSFYY
jgi:hypothetical protein